MTESRPWPGNEGPIFHLVPTLVWESRRDQETYLPEAFERDGFIHCTVGVENLLAVGNTFYMADHRPYKALMIDPDRVDVPIQFDDDTGIYPHIYGALLTAAVTDEFLVLRTADGAFVELVRDS